MLRRCSLVAPVLLVMVLATPLGAPVEAPAANAAPSAQARQDASLRLDWVPGPHHIGPALALERGYYAQEGINLRIGEGTGSGPTIQAVAGGQDTFGFADAATMVLSASRGAPVKMIANTTQKSPIGIIYLPSTPINTPQDLAGRTIGAAAGDAGLTPLPAAARLNGLSPDSYRVVTIEAATKVPALLERRVDTIVGFRFGDYLRAWVNNPEVRIALFADWGVNTLANGFLANERTLRERPELTRGFVQATLRGWQDATADPQAGIQALLRLFPNTREEFLTAGLPMVIEHFYNEDSQGRPLGWMAERSWQQTVDLLRQYGNLEGNPQVGSLYTNEFIAAP